MCIAPDARLNRSPSDPTRLRPPRTLVFLLIAFFIGLLILAVAELH